MTAEDKVCTLSCESGLRSIHTLDFLCMCSKSTFPKRKKIWCHIEIESNGSFKV